jgi:hypothetical protein
MLFFSVGEWQKLMKESSVFIFYGTQKCLNYVPPSLLVSFPLQGKNRYTMRTCMLHQVTTLRYCCRSI